MTKLLAPGAVCVVPESLGGLPVTELADKVFSGSTVEKVYLPRTLTRIGRYEFYGCEKLQEIHFYGALREVGGGVFTGCRNIRSLTVHMGVDEESALRDFVTEIKRESQYMCLYGQDKIECRTRETRTLHEYRWLQVLLRKRTGRQRLRV